jgi:hypothetical protein
MNASALENIGQWPVSRVQGLPIATAEEGGDGTRLHHMLAVFTQDDGATVGLRAPRGLAETMERHTPSIALRLDVPGHVGFASGDCM